MNNPRKRRAWKFIFDFHQMSECRFGNEGVGGVAVVEWERLKKGKQNAREFAVY